MLSTDAACFSEMVRASVATLPPLNRERFLSATAWTFLKSP